MGGNVGQLRLLTHLRWWAALAVVVFHLNVYLPLPGAAGHVAGYGYSAVTFFFVLSGFVLAWSWRPMTRRAFYWRRFARIYPSHATVVVGIVALGVACGVLGAPGFQPAGIPRTVLLVQTWWPSTAGRISGVSWSLCCEAVFYLVFPWLLAACASTWNRRAVLTVSVAAAGAVVAAVMAGGVTDAVAYYNPLLRLPEFGVGVALGAAARQRSHAQLDRWLSRRATLAVVGVTAAAACVLAVNTGSAPRLGQSEVNTLLLPMFALWVWTAAGVELDGRVPGWAVGRRAVWLGEVSFALYLVHAPILLVLSYRGWFPQLHFGAWAAFPLFVAALLVFAAAAAVHELVERPAQRALLALRANSHRRPGGSLAGCCQAPTGCVVCRPPVPAPTLRPDTPGE